ncbi:hypothetical protein [Methylocaldum sp.]|uniref:hypothetical protein n=1 Tax=Methylocaldum sp. TaxID=1969727 RepID=UPI002D6930FE|nr:hypothetical protein [Methylocaldum sp.]HYE36305.1 hypothetical protein [Methylocaldum sp.]
MEMACATQNPQLLHSSLTLQSTLEYSTGNYRSAIAIAREGIEIAQNMGDALQYLICEAICIRSLLHIGEWGEAKLHLANALQIADKNGNVFAATFFTSAMGWLHELAFDYEGARCLCAAAMEQVRDDPGSYNAFFVLIRLGLAHLVSCPINT